MNISSRNISLMTSVEQSSTFDRVFASADDVCEWLKEKNFEEEVIEAFKGDNTYLVYAFY